MSSKCALKILSQTCLQERTQNVNGTNKHVRVVVKNQPSLVRLALVGVEGGVDFRSVGVVATLLYDGLTEKPVDFLKVKPLDYSGHVGNNPLEYSLELLIHSLSSQHEDSLFKVKFQAVASNTRKPIAGLCCYTSEILVISKPEVLKPKATRGGSQKRPRDDQVLHHIARLEQKLDEMAASANRGREVLLLNNNRHNNIKVVNNEEKAPHLERAIPNLLSAFSLLSDAERPEKLRKVFRSLREDEKEQLSHLFNLFMVEGLPTRGGRSQLIPTTSDMVIASSPSTEEYPLVGLDTLVGSDFLRVSGDGSALQLSSPFDIW